MILALCGTSEAHKLLRCLEKRKYKTIATVTTDYGEKCLENFLDVEIIKGRIGEADLRQLVQEREIKSIIDVTHPYANVISTIAQKISKERKILYLRYERKETKLNKDTLITKVVDFSQAAQVASRVKGRIFLTTGSKNISIFTDKIDVSRMVIRVLPLSNIIKNCEEYGFSPDNIIAMKGPFSEELNKQMFIHYKASVVITKDSGEAGGTLEKINAAKELELPIILVGRPKTHYGEAFDDLNDLINKLENWYKPPIW
ncbi:precorrin-6A reductase [Alkaliphilus peptidifermentans]|uniref:Precorrin-6A/cobalt-precorrin-6A reductase n=1 Tax=Alkaliphilus peptidifermentans DSM 18978 TaxID=1120976 RepID=A0A1G5AQ77_9FIRM|nr:precorrin-6A reductase [Alkaliphilus peptidifermentans]SCX80034.1 precorrin-6A/cobalt-precorrin-6A reductase [Alkaliphilus peptidifermentans DSM 18978]